MRSALAAAATLMVTLALTPVSDAYVCSSAAGCEFWDNNYHEYILYSVDTYKIDALIVPPVSPFVLRDITTVEKSIDAWEAGIQALGAAWLTSKLDITRHTLGVDPPASIPTDPEILVLSAEYNYVLLFGIGLQTPVGLCTASGPTHQHKGSSMMAVPAQCTNGGKTCIVINTNFLLGGQRQMFDLNSHEFGHCLGIGHVGDAGDFDAKTVPMSDIMSYQYNPNQVHCVSNLNVRALEGVYAGLLGQPSLYKAPGTYIAMAPSSYTQVACANP